MYYIDDHTQNINNQLYTKKEIINRINNIIGIQSETLDDAIYQFNNYQKKQIQPWDINKTYIEITNDDIIGNIKPDNSFADTLEFYKFENVVNKDEYIVKEFSTLNSNQKMIICQFIEKSNNLLNELEKQNEEKPQFVSNTYTKIINHTVYELFLALNYNQAEYMILQMEIFNNIKNKILIEILNNIVEKTTIKELLSEDNFIYDMSNRFFEKITEINKNKKEDTND